MSNVPPFTDPLLEGLDADQFVIPSSAPPDAPEFPEYLEQRLTQYDGYVTQRLAPQLGGRMLDTRTGPTPFVDGIRTLSRGITRAVRCYYQGHVSAAAQHFNKALDALRITTLLPVAEIQPDARFYRTRLAGDHAFRREELFHNPFELRHLVSTNRYSIPGLPALYLGDSVYVCWEEYERPPIRTLYFSQFRNTRHLRLVKLQRLDDFKQELQHLGPRGVDNLTDTERFLALFPLALACTVKTRNPRAPFKPEYIVPQLLLQYVTTHKEVDGIMFPSTKVRYERIHGVKAYNYVLPVKEVRATGYCASLSGLFHLTEPTSLEVEDMISNSALYAYHVEELAKSGSLEIVEGVRSPYLTTAWGRLESVLQGRLDSPLPAC